MRQTGEVGRRWTYAALLAESERLALALASRFRPGERVVVWSPNSPEWVLMEYACALAGLVLVTANPAYQVRELRYVLEQSGAVALFLVDEYRGNPMAEIGAEAVDGLGAVREVVDMNECGGAMVAPELVRRVQRTFGCAFSTLYGQTEHSPVITQHHSDDSIDDICNTVGQAVPQTEVSIRRLADNRTADIGEVGEICARSACVMLSYHDDAASTAEAIDPQGWLHTGRPRAHGCARLRDDHRPAARRPPCGSTAWGPRGRRGCSSPATRSTAGRPPTWASC